MKFRKKPVVIEAVQVVPENIDVIDAMRDATIFVRPDTGEMVRVEVRTLEGTMTANPGDWIITGVKGERYPCKPDIFAKTYDAAGDGGKGPGLTGCSCLMCEFHRSAEAISNTGRQG